MYINLESDYAIRIVRYLSKQHKLVDAKTISQNVDVTLRFCLKILRKLANAQILKSYKGSKGGYIMYSDPRETSLKDIIEIIEGPINLSRCLDGTYVCGVSKSGKCKTQMAFSNITDKIRYELSRVSIQDLI